MDVGECRRLGLQHHDVALNGTLQHPDQEAPVLGPDQHLSDLGKRAPVLEREGQLTVLPVLGRGQDGERSGLDDVDVLVAQTVFRDRDPDLGRCAAGLRRDDGLPDGHRRHQAGVVHGRHGRIRRAPLHRLGGGESGGIEDGGVQSPGLAGHQGQRILLNQDVGHGVGAEGARRGVAAGGQGQAHEKYGGRQFPVRFHDAGPSSGSVT